MAVKSRKDESRRIQLRVDQIEFLISCACRYNIGRCTYSPHCFIEIVEEYLDYMTPTCMKWILDDIERAMPDGLGWDIDKKAWLGLRDKLLVRLDAEAVNAKYE